MQKSHFQPPTSIAWFIWLYRNRSRGKKSNYNNFELICIINTSQGHDCQKLCRSKCIHFKAYRFWKSKTSLSHFISYFNPPWMSCIMLQRSNVILHFFTRELFNIQIRSCSGSNPFTKAWQSFNTSHTNEGRRGCCKHFFILD